MSDPCREAFEKVEIRPGTFTLVDPEDAELIRGKTLSVNKKKEHVYARISIGGEKIRLHRFLMGVHEDASVVVDHKNGDGLDNRRSNLRVCSAFENARNRGRSKTNKTGLKGVIFDSRRGRFYSQICFNRNKIHLGTFSTAQEAYDAYCEKAKELHGEYARF